MAKDKKDSLAIPKNITHPSKAGAHNMPKELTKRQKEMDDVDNDYVAELFRISITMGNRATAWTPELLANRIAEYFDWSVERHAKPSKAALRAFLGISTTQYWEWEKKEKFASLAKIVKRANDIIEASYVTRAEKYPASNIFLLKSSHGHKDTAVVEVVNKSNGVEDVKELISNLGLADKQKK